jgi:hypothetical protein
LEKEPKGMTLSRSNPRARQRWLGLVTIVTFLMALAAGGVLAASGTDASVSDYSQCANGKPGTSAPTTDCDGYIFGILNANNSQYAEDQVTAQRLMLDLPKNGSLTGRTIQLKWLVRKGVHHAYDSLATWNKTQTTADACQSLNTPTAALCNSLLADKSVLPIPSDGSTVTPNSGVGASGTALTSDHQLSGQQLEMYGLGTTTGIDSMTYGSLVDESGDLYQSATITYHVASLTSPRKVMLLFGGHLAAGGGPRSWGSGNGASDINGGPYHIKLIQVDGASIGNRDNQIMSSAILPLSVTVATELHQTTAAGADIATANNGASITVDLPADGTGAYVKDIATSSDPGASGSVAFKYYPSLADCTADTNGTAAGSGIALSSGTAASTVVHFTSPGTFYWRAFLTGSDITQDATSACGDEVLTVRQSTTAATQLHERTSAAGTTDVNPANNGKNITVFPGAYVNDTVTVTPAAATGTVAFKTYSSLADCTNDTNGTSRGSGLALTANSDTVQFSTPGTFYWRAFFSGTNGNLSSSSPCVANDSESVTVRTVATSLSTSPKAFPNDSATVAASVGGNVTGSVTFKMYSSLSSCQANGATGLLFSETVALPGNAMSSTVGTHNGDSADLLADYSVDADATVWWRTTFASTNANQIGRESLCLETTAIDHTADSSGGTAP